jgi:hypothetical protein
MTNSTNPQIELVPCTNCGSLARKIELNLHDSIKIYDSISTVLFNRKPSGGKKILQMGKYGWEFHQDSKTWQERKRTIDISNNKYEEIITNPTIPFKREVSEKLSDHKNRGSDKMKKDK